MGPWLHRSSSLAHQTESSFCESIYPIYSYQLDAILATGSCKSSHKLTLSHCNQVNLSQCFSSCLLRSYKHALVCRWSNLDQQASVRQRTKPKWKQLTQSVSILNAPIHCSICWIERYFESESRQAGGFWVVHIIYSAGVAKLNVPLVLGSSLFQYEHEATSGPGIWCANAKWLCIFELVKWHAALVWSIHRFILSVSNSHAMQFAHPGPGPMADASPLSVHIATSPEGSRTHGGASQSKGQQTQKMDADQASHLNCFFCTWSFSISFALLRLFEWFLQFRGLLQVLKLWPLLFRTTCSEICSTNSTDGMFLQRSFAQ